MTNEKRIQALQRFGYNEREAALLLLAALHSGFLGRQYAGFLGQQRGRPDHLLCRKILARRHGSVAASLDQTCVYHLSSRLLFSAIGEPDNRNRRPRSPRTIKRRLMQLDYVLANRDVLYLPTERAKVDFFVEETSIDQSVLPVKRYRSKDGASFTLRYFVDKFPVHVSDRVDGGVSPVTFCFIDAGESTISAFKTYLEQYRKLLFSLRLAKFSL